MGRAALVSVIVATNRVGPYFAEALASARDQTYSNLEIIVVDDGAPDSAAVDRTVGSVPKARVIHQAAAGVSVARNVGIAEASGEFVAFLDDDDRWDPRRLEWQIAGLMNAPDAVTSYCAMRTVDEDGEQLAEADQVPITDRLDVARRTTGIILPNTIVRRDALVAAGGFHADIRLAEDLDLMLRLAERGAFVFEPRTLVDYRSHGSNTTARHRPLVASIERVLRLHQGNARERGDRDLVAALQVSRRKNQRFAWWSAGRAAKLALRQRKPVLAADELWWALRTSPTGLLDGVVRRLNLIRRRDG